MNIIKRALNGIIFCLSQFPFLSHSTLFRITPVAQETLPEAVKAVIDSQKYTGGPLSPDTTSSFLANNSSIDEMFQEDFMREVSVLFLKPGFTKNPMFSPLFKWIVKQPFGEEYCRRLASDHSIISLLNNSEIFAVNLLKELSEASQISSVETLLKSMKFKKAFIFEYIILRALVYLPYSIRKNILNEIYRREHKNKDLVNALSRLRFAALCMHETTVLMILKFDPADQFSDCVEVAISHRDHTMLNIFTKNLATIKLSRKDLKLMRKRGYREFERKKRHLDEDCEFLFCLIQFLLELETPKKDEIKLLRSYMSRSDIQPRLVFKLMEYNKFLSLIPPFKTFCNALAWEDSELFQRLFTRYGNLLEPNRMLEIQRLCMNEGLLQHLEVLLGWSAADSDESQLMAYKDVLEQKCRTAWKNISLPDAPLPYPMRLVLLAAGRTINGPLLFTEDIPKKALFLFSLTFAELGRVEQVKRLLEQHPTEIRPRKLLFDLVSKDYPSNVANYLVNHPNIALDEYGFDKLLRKIWNSWNNKAGMILRELIRNGRFTFKIKHAANVIRYNKWEAIPLLATIPGILAEALALEPDLRENLFSQVPFLPDFEKSGAEFLIELLSMSKTYSSSPWAKIFSFLPLAFSLLPTNEILELYKRAVFQNDLVLLEALIESGSLPQNLLESTIVKYRDNEKLVRSIDRSYDASGFMNRLVLLFIIYMQQGGSNEFVSLFPYLVDASFSQVFDVLSKFEA